MLDAQYSVLLVRVENFVGCLNSLCNVRLGHLSSRSLPSQCQSLIRNISGVLSFNGILTPTVMLNVAV